jgi:hypothetical protein
MRISTQRLAHALGFNAHDLACNRRGELSPRQQNQMQLKPYLYAALWVLLMGGLAALGWYIFTTETGTTQLICLGGTGVFALFASFIILSNIRDLVRDKRSGAVHNTTGPVECVREYDDPGYSYYCYVGGGKFSINRRTYDLLKRDRGGVYRVYYLPLSQELLSVEPV